MLKAFCATATSCGASRSRPNAGAARSLQTTAAAPRYQVLSRSSISSYYRPSSWPRLAALEESAQGGPSVQAPSRRPDPCSSVRTPASPVADVGSDDGLASFPASLSARRTSLPGIPPPDMHVRQASTGHQPPPANCRLPAQIEPDSVRDVITLWSLLPSFDCFRF